MNEEGSKIRRLDPLSHPVGPKCQAFPSSATVLLNSNRQWAATGYTSLFRFVTLGSSTAIPSGGIAHNLGLVAQDTTADAPTDLKELHDEEVAPTMR